MGNGELHPTELSMKLYSIISINLSIKIKTNPWSLTAWQEFHRKRSKLAVVLLGENKLREGCVM